MDGLSRQYIRETNKLTYDRLSEEVITRAKKCIIHQMACTAPMRDEKWGVAASDYVRSTSGGGRATVWFSGVKCNAFEAVLANTTTGSSLIQEDIHREDGIHPGCIIVPCAIAMGEQYGLSGKAVIESIVKGYQFLCRVGKCVVTSEFNSRGFRPTTIMGPFANAVTAGSLLGLSEDELVSAVGIAGNFSCGVNEWAHTGASEVYFQNGFSAAGGILAAEAAKRGVTGSESILEGSDGSCNAYGLSKEALYSSVKNDDVLEICKVVFKGAPTCNFNQGAAALALLAANDGVRPEDIESGTLWTNTRGTLYPGVDSIGPFDTTMQAKMSQQYTFAALLTYGKPVNDAFRDYHNGQILNLVSRLKLRSKPEYDLIYPARMQGEVELVMKDGGVLHYKTEEGNFYNNEQVDEGFRYYFSQIYDSARVDSLLDMLNNLESLDNIQKLGELLGA